MKSQERYKPNPAYDGRKERDGFVCGPGTTRYCTFCVAVKIDDNVQIRDTKDDKDNTLTFNRKEWGVFVQAVKDGLYDV